MPPHSKSNTPPSAPKGTSLPPKQPRRVVATRKRLTLDESGVIRLDNIITRPAPLYSGYDLSYPDDWKAEIQKIKGELGPSVAKDTPFWPIGLVARRGVFDVCRNFIFLWLAALCGVNHVYCIEVSPGDFDPKIDPAWEHCIVPALIRQYTDHARLVRLLGEGKRRGSPIVRMGRKSRKANSQAKPPVFAVSKEQIATIAKFSPKTMYNHLTPPKPKRGPEQQQLALKAVPGSNRKSRKPQVLKTAHPTPPAVKREQPRPAQDLSLPLLPGFADDGLPSGPHREAS